MVNGPGESKSGADQFNTDPSAGSKRMMLRTRRSSTSAEPAVAIVPSERTVTALIVLDGGISRNQRRLPSGSSFAMKPCRVICGVIGSGYLTVVPAPTT